MKFIKIEIEEEDKNINLIREQLEKAYTPLNNIVSKKRRYGGPSYMLIDFYSKEEKKAIDDIFIYYSHLIDDDLVQSWREEIEPLKPTYLNTPGWDSERDFCYNIPKKFGDKIRKGYEGRNKIFKRLTKKMNIDPK
jgi:hypothetical protein